MFCGLLHIKTFEILLLTACNPKEWKQSKDISCPAIALYDFVAVSDKELSFNAGQTMVLAPKELQPHDARGWLLATLDGNRVGYIPYNYIRVLSTTGQAASLSAQRNPVYAQSLGVNSHQGRVGSSYTKN